MLDANECDCLHCLVYFATSQLNARAYKANEVQNFRSSQVHYTMMMFFKGNKLIVLILNTAVGPSKFTANSGSSLSFMYELIPAHKHHTHNHDNLASRMLIHVACLSVRPHKSRNRMTKTFWLIKLTAVQKGFGCQESIAECINCVTN